MTTRNTNTNTNTVTIEEFAYGVGSMTTQLRESSLSFRNAYAKGDAVQQRDLRVRWMCNHLRGALNVTLTQAETIREGGKGGHASKAHKLAIDRAYSDFRYYVARPVAKAAATSNSVKITNEMRALLTQLDALCTTYPEMRSVCNAYISKASK